MVGSAVLACGLGIAALGTATAQEQAPPPPPPGQMQGPPPGGRRGMDPARRAERMQHELNLTDDQTRQVKAILEDSRTKMEALRANSAGSQEDRRSQMMSVRKAQEDRIEALLTPEQKTKYEQMRAQMRDRRRDGEGGPPAGDAAPPPPSPAPPQN